MANIFSLYGSIFIDNEKANKSIDETTEKGKKSSSTFLESAGNIVKKGAEIGTAIAGATTAVVGGLTAMVNSTASVADTFDKASYRTGLNVEELQRLKYAADQSGLSLDTIEKSAKKMNERLAEVSEGNDKSAKMFQNLGVSIKDSNGQMKDTTTIYNDVLLKLAEMGDTAEATAIGTDLFGKAFTDMKPLLASGADGIEELKNRADELGIVMGEDAVAAGVVFGDTMADIKASFGGIVNNLSATLIPIIQVVLDLIIANLPMIQAMFTQLMPVLQGLLENALPPLMSLAQSILPIIFNLISLLLPFFTKITEAILPIIINLLEMFLPPIIQIVEQILPLLLMLIEPLLPLLEPILNLLQPLIDLLLNLLQPLIELMNLILPPIIELFTTIIDFILPPLQMALEYTAGILSDIFNRAFENLAPIIEKFKGILQGIITFIKAVFTGDWKKAWEGIKQIFENIVGTFVNIFKAPINFIIDGLNKFIDWLNSIKIPDWVPGVGGLGFNFKHFDRLRHGLDYVPYDEYPAMLHRGERVLTASENEEYAKGSGGITLNFYDTQIYDDRGVDMLMDKVVARLRLEGAC